MTFRVAVLLYAYIIAREEEDEQQTDQLQSQPQRARRDAVRQFWVRPWLREERRQQLGQLSSLMDTHLRLEDPVAFQNYTRLTPQLFDEVLQRVAAATEREVTTFRQPLSHGLKLAVTLRHLATGDNYLVLSKIDSDHHDLEARLDAIYRALLRSDTMIPIDN